MVLWTILNSLLGTHTDDNRLQWIYICDCRRFYEALKLISKAASTCAEDNKIPFFMPKGCQTNKFHFITIAMATHENDNHSEINIESFSRKEVQLLHHISTSSTFESSAKTFFCFIIFLLSFPLFVVAGRLTLAQLCWKFIARKWQKIAFLENSYEV